MVNKTGEKEGRFGAEELANTPWNLSYSQVGLIKNPGVGVGGRDLT